MKTLFPKCSLERNEEFQKYTYCYPQKKKKHSYIIQFVYQIRQYRQFITEKNMNYFPLKNTCFCFAANLVQNMEAKENILVVGKFPFATLFSYVFSNLD